MQTARTDPGPLTPAFFERADLRFRKSFGFRLLQASDFTDSVNVITQSIANLWRWQLHPFNFIL